MHCAEFNALIPAGMLPWLSNYSGCHGGYLFHANSQRLSGGWKNKCSTYITQKNAKHWWVRGVKMLKKWDNTHWSLVLRHFVRRREFVTTERHGGRTGVCVRVWNVQSSCLSVDQQQVNTVLLCRNTQCNHHLSTITVALQTGNRVIKSKALSIQCEAYSVSGVHPCCEYFCHFLPMIIHDNSLLFRSEFNQHHINCDLANLFKIPYKIFSLTMYDLARVMWR